jgi:hypothetical protein
MIKLKEKYIYILKNKWKKHYLQKQNKWNESEISQPKLGWKIHNWPRFRTKWNLLWVVLFF